MFGVQQQQQNNPNGDLAVTNPPTDGISSLGFSPVSNLLCAGSWDNQVRVWDIQPNGQSVPKAAISHEGPVLCTSWKKDGSVVFSGSCDKTAKMWQLAGNQPVQVGQHDAPIKHCFWIEESQMLLTGSWDKTMKFWDMRSPRAALSVQLPERVYAMDITYPVCVVGTAERYILLFDLTNPQQPVKRIQSPLKYQTRCISCFPSPNESGYAIGSIEGRVGIEYVDDKFSNKRFAFKCHRVEHEVYAVNSISFHPSGTFATCGSDGTFHFWDKDHKQRLKAFQSVGQPITCSDFNTQGNIFAYAASYDWSKGHEFYNPQTARNMIYLHSTPDNEIRSKKKNAGRR